MAAVLKVWRQIENLIPSIDVYLLEEQIEQSHQISSRPGLKHRESDARLEKPRFLEKSF